MSAGVTIPDSPGRATGKAAPEIQVESGWVKASVEAASKPKPRRVASPKPGLPVETDPNVKKCGCGAKVNGKHGRCGMCEKADKLAPEQREARLMEIREMRAAGKVRIGRPPGYRPGSKGWPLGKPRANSIDREAIRDMVLAGKMEMEIVEALGVSRSSVSIVKREMKK